MGLEDGSDDRESQAEPVPTSNVMEALGPAGTPFFRLPTTCPLVRETLLPWVTINVLAPVRMFP